MILKFLKRFVVFLVVVIFFAWIFWPQEWVVKGPILSVMTGEMAEVPASATVASRFKLPDGYKIGVFASGLPNARVMVVTSAGDIVVSLPRVGEIALVKADRDGDGQSDGTEILLRGLNKPHGITIKGEYIYIAENHQISRYIFDGASGDVTGAQEVIFTGLPVGGNHWTRTIAFGPDGRLYVTVGSSCNVCLETEDYRASMLVMDADGSNARTYATGLRNSAGFDWHPETGALYANDNGRDLLGDDLPNCELNHIVDGGFYGWPFAYDDNVIDESMGRGHEAKVATATPPAHGYGGHRAPLGMRFIKGEGYLKNSALVALHGSWNHSQLVGYKVVSLIFDDDGSIMQQDFLTGFAEGDDVIGRPVDIEEGPDGAIYVSDDYTGSIYRIVTGDMVVASSAETEHPRIVDPLAGISSDEVDMYATLGSELYVEHNCVECHEPSNKGIEIKELVKLGERYTVDDIIKLLDTPPGPMPRPEIDDEARKALAVYVLVEKG